MKGRLWILPLIILVLVAAITRIHRLVMAGMNPLFSNLMVYLLIPLLFVVCIILMHKLTKGLFRKENMSISRLFFIGAVLFMIIATIRSIFFNNSAIDFQFHDTYFVVAEVHIWFMFALTYVIFSAIYGSISSWLDLEWNKILGHSHFWIPLLCIFLLMWPSFQQNLNSVPRRYYTFESVDTSISFHHLLRLALFVFFLAQLLFPINLVYSLLRKKHI